MPEKAPHRLRIKLANGSEMEAEGGPEFIASERKEFFALQTPPAGAAPTQPDGRPLEPSWEGITETHGSDIQLRAKLRGGKSEKEACLILLAASKRVLRIPKPTAAQLARWLRASGYPVRRVDRAIQAALELGDILASGSRRGRRYELSGPGTAKAFNLGHQLSAFIKPA